ncbi:MAG: YibE/F family protein [Patescibacteria group bacterium]
MFRKFFIVVALLLFPLTASAQETSARGLVQKIIEEVATESENYQILDVLVQSGEFAGEIVQVNTRDPYLAQVPYRVDVGNRVVLQFSTTPDGSLDVYLSDVVRTRAMLWIVLVFVFVTLVVARRRGFMSLLSLAITFLTLFGFVLPLIYRGVSPVLVSVVGAWVILASSMVFSHGLRRSTYAAFAGTGAGLILIVILSDIFIRVTHLSGLTSEGAMFLTLEAGVGVPAGILLAGFILGATGVLDDVAVTQSEVVFELKEANRNLPSRELYVRAMRVGQHHIASVVNTLVLAYAGASLPLLLLFITDNPLPLAELINTEPIAEEIIRTLAGTIGLILTVPLTTWFASLLAKR